MAMAERNDRLHDPSHRFPDQGLSHLLVAELQDMGIF